MKALVYGGPGEKSWTDVPDPKIQNPSDVIVKVDTTTICGTDLHILKGDVPAVTKGRILGHEGVGTITEIGSSVTSLKVGDRVIISCIKSCGHCANCKTGLYSHCMGEEGASGIGWVFGHLIDGTQAEYVRVPYAENSLHLLPEGVSDEQAVMLSDILPTGFEIGVQYGRVKPGDTVAVIGAGPVGLAAIATAGLYGAATIIAVDLDANRLDKSREFGATDIVLSGDTDWKEQVLALTDGQGVDVAIEAVGLPETWEQALAMTRPGGLANLFGGCQEGTQIRVDTRRLHYDELQIIGVFHHTPRYVRTALSLIAGGQIDASGLITHEMGLERLEEALQLVASGQALKVAIVPGLDDG